MVRMSEDEVREALNRVYTEESSALDVELIRMQSASLPDEDWPYVDEDSTNELADETS